MPNLRLSLLFSLMLLPFLAGAVEVHGLYQAEVPVSDQGPAARAEAIAGALEEVLIKVSGVGTARDVTSVTPEEAAQSVQQYRYRQGEASRGDGLRLQVRFEPDVVKRLLQQRGLPVWGGARPLTLVWLAVEEGGRRLLVGANDAGQAQEIVLAAGKRVGLPVRLPLLDLTDQSRVEPADIWGDFHQPILEVSQRYDPQAILVGRMFPATGGQWRVRWSLYFGDTRERWGSDGGNVSDVIASGMEGAADRLSRAFAKTGPSDGVDSLILDVAEVTGLAAYRRVLEYLQSLEGVSRVNLLQVDARTRVVSFELAASSGAVENVVRTLDLGDTLVPEAWQLEQGSRGRLYRLVP